MSIQTLIIVNPFARKGEFSDRWVTHEKEILDALGESSVRVERVSPARFGSQIAREALEQGTRRLVVVGGDGTFSEVIQGVCGEVRPEVVYLMPAGRGDDFFKMLCGKRFQLSEQAWETGLQIIRGGVEKPTDLGKVTFLDSGQEPMESRFFANVAGFGYPGRVVERVQEYGGGNALAYLKQIVGGIREFSPVKVEVRVDDRLFFEGEIFSGFVLNGRYSAGGICWSKSATVDDGLFHLALFEPMGALDWLKTAARLPRIAVGDWEGMSGAHLTSGRKIEVRRKGRIQPKHPLFEIDGDLPEPKGTLGARFEIVPGAVRMGWY